MTQAMRTYTYTVKIHPPDDENSHDYVQVPALPGCFTQGDTFEQAIAMAQDAITCHLEGLIADGEPIPEGTPMLLSLRHSRTGPAPV